MTIAEFMVFVAIVCNFDAPVTVVPQTVKEDCMEYYVNCAIDNDLRVDRLKVSNCNIKAKKASKKWGL